jgi:hypothetical protein
MKKGALHSLQLALQFAQLCRGAKGAIVLHPRGQSLCMLAVALVFVSEARVEK